MMLSKRWVSLVSLCVINVETNSFSKTSSSNILNSLIDVLKLNKKKISNKFLDVTWTYL